VGGRHGQRAGAAPNGPPPQLHFRRVSEPGMWL
jgi:hypothetical protein